MCHCSLCMLLFLTQTTFFMHCVREVDRTSMLAISTPSPEGNLNFYTTMMDSKDPNTGKPLFKVLKVGLACDACQAAGIASECTHMESFRPPWKSASKVSGTCSTCDCYFSSALTYSLHCHFSVCHGQTNLQHPKGYDGA